MAARIRALAAAAGALATACGGSSPSPEDGEDRIRECVRRDRPNVPDACIDAYLEAVSDALHSTADAYVTAGYDEGFDTYVDSLCSQFIMAVDEAVAHSSDSVPATEPSLTFTEVCLKAALSFQSPPAPGSMANVAPPASDVDELYPCGDDGERNVLCASPTFPAGTTASLAMVMTGDIPRGDPIRTHQFGFVFDADGDTGNNYQASAQYPNDFFDATDRWYVAAYTPAAGWRLSVSNATGGTVQPATSAARLVIDGPVMQLIVPAAELPAACPGYRMTSFSHTGDYGQNPPYDWSGDVEPAVALPLESTCVELPPRP